MKKLAFKIFVFSLITLLFFKLSEKHFIKENRFNYANHKFNTLSKTLEFDLLFFGSSKSYCAFNPSIFNYNLNINSFNLAGQDQTLDVTGFVIDEALKKNKPKLIIVDVSESLFFIKEEDSNSVKRKAFQLPIYDNFGLSFSKIIHINSMYKGEQAFYALSPTIRNHSKWIDALDHNYKKHFLEGKNNIFLSNNGYIGALKSISENDLEAVRELDRINDTLSNLKTSRVSQKEILILKQIKSIADKHKVEVLFVSTPQIEDYKTNFPFYVDLENVFESLDANYLNLYKEFENILTSKDFKDIVHLNYDGGFKISTVLAEYIKDNYNKAIENSSLSDYLKNNITYNLLTDLKHLNKITNSPFQFNDEINCNEIGYFEEAENRFVFILKLENNFFENNQLDNYRGYIRYYNGEINNENKNVNGFPLKVIDINKDKFIFARVLIDASDISKFDVFFLDKKSKKPSKTLTIKDLKLIKYAD